MGGFVINTKEEQKSLDEGLTILARIFAQNILKEVSSADSIRNEVAYA